MRIYIDCTDTYFSGLNTGIQRVVRNIVGHARSAEAELDVECIPVVFQNGRYRKIDSLNDFSFGKLIHKFRQKLNHYYSLIVAAILTRVRGQWLKKILSAHRKEFGLAGLLFLPFSLLSKLIPKRPPAPQNSTMPDSLFDKADDILFLPDSGWARYDRFALERLKARGVKLVFFIHDIFPVTHPQFFQHLHVEGFTGWLSDVAVLADGLVCNSAYSQRAVSEKFAELQSPLLRGRIRVAPLGYDFVSPILEVIKHKGLREALSVQERCYLCVGTIEPRKDYSTVLDAMDIYWDGGGQGRLILVGRYGWLCKDVTDRIKRHPEFAKRLFWFDTVSDEDLSSCYDLASSQIIASIAEGFGLPLVEALGRGLPVIASDIEVFREIASGYVSFFTPQDADSLAAELFLFEQQDPVKVRAQIAAFNWPNWQRATHGILDQVAQIGRSYSSQEGLDEPCTQISSSGSP